MSGFTLNDRDVLFDLSVNSLSINKSNTKAYIGIDSCYNYYSTYKNCVTLDFVGSSTNLSTEKMPLIINPWSGGESGGVIIGALNANYLKGSGYDGSYMLFVNGKIKCTTPTSTDESTAVATIGYVKDQGYLTSVSSDYAKKYNETFTGYTKVNNLYLTSDGTSSIYDDAQLHIKTDDNMYFDIGTTNIVYVNNNNVEMKKTLICPTPATTTNDTTVATTAYVKAQGYLTSVTNITGTAGGLSSTLAISSGGTGATTPDSALLALGIYFVRIKLTNATSGTGATTTDGFNGYMTLINVNISASALIIATIQYNDKASLWNNDASITVTILNQTVNTAYFAFRSTFCNFEDLLLKNVYVNILIKK